MMDFLSAEVIAAKSCSGKAAVKEGARETYTHSPRRIMFESD